MNHHPISKANKREQQTQQQWIQQVARNLRWEELQTKLRKTENFDFKFWASNGTAEANASTKHRGCKEAATKYYNYTANKADEEREHRLPMFQQNAVNTE